MQKIKTGRSTTQKWRAYRMNYKSFCWLTDKGCTDHEPISFLYSVRKLKQQTGGDDNFYDENKNQTLDNQLLVLYFHLPCTFFVIFFSFSGLRWAKEEVADSARYSWGQTACSLWGYNSWRSNRSRKYKWLHFVFKIDHAVSSATYLSHLSKSSFNLRYRLNEVINRSISWLQIYLQKMNNHFFW